MALAELMSKIIADYVADTGEKFSDALTRLQKENYTGYDAALYIGFNSKQSLDYAMKARGIEIQFRSVKLLGVSRNAKAIKALRRSRRVEKPVKKTEPIKVHPWRLAERKAHEEAQQRAAVRN